jgi:hypothetical protein
MFPYALRIGPPAGLASRFRVRSRTTFEFAAGIFASSAGHREGVAPKLWNLPNLPTGKARHFGNFGNFNRTPPRKRSESVSCTLIASEKKRRRRDMR